MPNAPETPLILDENYRLQVLADLQLLDTPPAPAFDSIALLARRITGAPTALLSLVDAERQWFKARCGMDKSETSRDIAFCSHAIRRPDVMEVRDARLDPRFAENPLVTGAAGIVSYIGVPLLVKGKGEGPPAPIGTLCVLDTKVRVLSDEQMVALRDLANVAVTLIDARRVALRAIDHAQLQQQMAHQLAYEQRKSRQAERMASIGYWRLDLADEHIHWSDHVYAIHGLPVGTPPPLSSLLEFYPPHARGRLATEIAEVVETGVAFDVELDFLTAQGAERRVRSIGELEIVDGQSVAVFGVFQDVTERYWLEQGLRRSAHRDALTGLANRAALDEELEARIAAVQASGGNLAIMLVDLDGFKAVNDAQGHMAGDELLQAVATRFQAPAYADCFVARLGGDEFVLIPGGAYDTASLEERARQVLHDLHCPITTSECAATISGTIGIARLHADDTRRDLMRRADQALYAAKNNQRGTARIYGSSRSIHLDPRPLRQAG
jgi:diguanylate cyclase (GGDEF)-like protein